MRTLSLVDPEIAALLDKEAARQNMTLEMIASENFVPPAILEAQGSILTNKYAEGYPGNRYHGGCEFIDGIEALAIERAKSLFGADHANVQPHSGVNANLGVYQAVLQPHDTILSMDLRHGGHLSHGAKASITGRFFNIVHYGVHPETERIDYDQVEALALEHRPKLIVAGGSAYPRVIDFPRFREIADKAGALFMVDMAHIAGLVAAKVHPSPVPYADFVTSTTTKTLRGARGGFILCRKDYAQKIDKAIFPGTQGGPILQNVMAKAVTFRIAGTSEFASLQARVVKNAATLAGVLSAAGYRIVSGGTDNHLMLVDMRPRGMTGVFAEETLAKIGIMVNKNLIPFDTAPATITSGIRIGAAAVSTRGLAVEDLENVGGLMDQALSNASDEKLLEGLRAQVREICLKHPLYLHFGEGALI
jgi:glycine hydroxymethyltransferase